MKITHYLYNTFVIEGGEARVAIDPGQHLGLFRLESLIPESEWPSITHIVITHGDPDHHWQSDRVAKASGAHVICGRGLTRKVDGEVLVVDPRGRGLTSWVPFDHLHPLEVGESVTLDGIKVDAVKTTHGPISIPILGFKLKRQPGPGERVGLGSMGFRISLDDTTILNFGDSILLDEWRDVRADVLMLPIGGLGNSTWTMDVDEAVEAVRMIAPTLVMPCHYNVPFLWIRNAAPADEVEFKRQVEALGVECRLMRYGDEVIL